MLGIHVPLNSNRSNCKDALVQTRTVPLAGREALVDLRWMSLWDRIDSDETSDISQTNNLSVRSAAVDWIEMKNVA
jgi:hypothetical protein